jgi:DNA-binding GntR family transcriptional regulator
VSLRLTVTKDSLVSQVAKQLTSAIRNGQIPAGTRPVETEMAQRLNISRGPLREALQQLSQSGLVVKVPNRGWFVLKPSARELADMVIMRGVLEGLAAWLVATRRDPRSLEALAGTVRAMQAAARCGDGERMRQLDREFHEGVCRASGNQSLLRSWHMVHDGISVVMSPGDASYRDTEELVERHERLLAALREGTPASAGRLFEERSLGSGSQLLGGDALAIALEGECRPAGEGPLAEVGLVPELAGRPLR